MLEKAQKKKDHFETNNKKLKDFIQKIRDFLTGIMTLFQLVIFGLNEDYVALTLV